jgi:hypothetical protein
MWPFLATGSKRVERFSNVVQYNTIQVVFWQRRLNCLERYA